MRDEKTVGNAAFEEAFGKVMDLVLDWRSMAKSSKDWTPPTEYATPSTRPASR
jgi:hypothetical protein